MSETEINYNQIENSDELSTIEHSIIAKADLGSAAIGHMVEFTEPDIFDYEADDDEEVDEDLADLDGFSKPEIGIKENLRIIEDGKTRDKIVKEILEQYKEHPKVLSAVEKIKKYSPNESSTPSQKYFHEVNQYDVLTQEQQLSLFKILELGINNFAQNRKGEAELDENTMIDAAVAQQTLYLSNLRLVLRFAFGRARTGKIEALDLIQEGNDGLSHAINRFDYQRGLKFSTYAVLWIRQRMQKYTFEKTNPIRIPNHMQEKRDNVVNVYGSLKQNLGREPTMQEISDKTGQSKDTVKTIFITDSLKETISLDTPLENVEGDLTIGDGIKSSENLEENEVLNELFTDEIIDTVFGGDILTLKEKYILSLRYGVIAEKLMGTSLRLGGNKRVHYDELTETLLSGESTLDSVGQIFGLTRERIRQIHKKALTHLQRSDKIQQLAPPSDAWV